MAQNYFNRYEFKYILPWKIYTSLQKELVPYCEPDEFCVDNGPYQIINLYYDTIPEMSIVSSPQCNTCKCKNSCLV